MRWTEWAEINRTGRVWTVPARRAKTNRRHRVPLCGRALEILEAAQALEEEAGPLVFTHGGGRPLHDSQLRRLLRELGVAAVPHGFRSTFRDWAGEETDHPREVIEAALAHVVRNRVEAAYARSDLFERRRVLMDDWAHRVPESKEAQGDRSWNNPLTSPCSLAVKRNSPLNHRFFPCGTMGIMMTFLQADRALATDPRNR